jgi:hypothetical protein
MRRCHFVGNPIGNIYTENWPDALQARACPNAVCSCHIGYVYLEPLRQDLIYGENLLERIPLTWPRSPSNPANEARVDTSRASD